VDQIGEEHQDLLLIRIPVLDPPEQDRLLTSLVQGRQRDDLVAQYVAFFWNRTYLHSPVDRVGLHARHEEDPVLRQLPKPLVIVVAPINGQDGSCFQI
jgi:hypothetical protein